MVTKTAQRLFPGDSPGHAIYDMMRMYRRGARNGITLAPIANDKRSEELKEEVEKASTKLDRIKELKEKGLINIKPVEPILPVAK